MFEKSEESPRVSLDRNLPFESGIEYHKDHYYRMIGESGYDDFLETGTIQAKQDSKQGYERAYYFKGCPIDRYSNRRARVQYFVEVKPTEGLFDQVGVGYPFSVRPVTSTDQIRVYKYSVSDGAEIVFDSFKE